jgi:hypothetical protein
MAVVENCLKPASRRIAKAKRRLEEVGNDKEHSCGTYRAIGQREPQR